MQSYQEEYIANVKDIAALTAHKSPGGRSFEEYLEELLANRQEAEQKTNRNMELLREGLQPTLEHLFEAGAQELASLREFASSLLAGTNEVDGGLFCQIHQALLSLARLNRDKKQMIQELYWLGIGRNNLCNKMVGLETTGAEKYTHKMRLCFTEAAAYLKYYDEIEDTQTRGYILRSRANISLGHFRSPGEKIRLTRQTLEILQDSSYQEKEPGLPWERFIYMTHQQMASSISRSKTEVMAPEDIAALMDSVYIVYERMIREAAEQSQKPPLRSAFSYASINYYCGLDTLDGLLFKMEQLMDETDIHDFSPDNMYGLISIPAFYCQYLQEYPERLPRKKDYVESLYQKILDYLRIFPQAAGNESLFFYLRQLSCTFVETGDGISYGEFLQKLLILFAPDIYVHSYMVGKASCAFCRIILSEEPSYFDDIDHIRAVKDPQQKQAAVLDYAMQCGLFHDVGNLNFISLYTQISRQWFAEEYEISKLHTVAGNMSLSQRPSTRLYAEAAHGHHSWHDGSRGYPGSYRRLECPQRQMVDIIGITDFLDSITSMGQLHFGAKKTYAEAVREAILLEGRRFSPLLTARLRDKEIARILREAFEEGRREAYYHLYEQEASS